MSLPVLDGWWIHAGACLLAGMLAWTLGLALHRGLRISHAARSYWLVVWAMAVLPTGLAITFQYFAPADAGWMLPAPLPLPSGAETGGWSDGLEARLHGVRAASNLRTWFEPLLWSLYLAGTGVAALRWGMGALGIRRIVRTSRPVDPAALPGPLSIAEQERLQRLGVSLDSTTRAITPFVVCWPRRTIIIPTVLFRCLGDQQLQMVLRHEAHHLVQHDPQRAALMRLVGVAFWFNPFLRLIAGRVQLAAELRCDVAAAGAEPEARRAYAGAYLDALRLSARAAMPAPAVAFSRHDPGSHKLRIRHMVQGDPRRRLALPLRVALVASALAFGSALATVQVGAVLPVRSPIADAETAGDPLASAALEVAEVRQVRASTIALAAPLAAPRITSHYGADGGVRTRPHRGLDFAAARGTPVLAPADGTVTVATTRYPDGPNYGTVVVLDHGGGWQSLYAHLDGLDVRPGQRVAAGTQIGRAGTTGKVTGPHLHMELLLNGQRVDPEPLLR